MANLIGFNCPECGGEISIREGVKNTVCPYCGRRLMLTTSIGMERYYIKPTVVNPRLAAKEWVGGNNILDVDMLFIPIIKLHTEIMGWVYAYKKGTIEWIPGNDYEQPMKIIKGQNRIKKRINVMRDIKLFPSQGLPIDGNRIVIDGLQLLPYEDEKLHLYGNVMDPPETKDYYLKEGIQKLTDEIISGYKNYDELKYKLEPVCPRLTIYYYPVIVIRFEGGTISIDAIRKKPLFRVMEEKKEEKNLPIPLVTLLFSIVVAGVSMKDIKAAAILFFVLLIFLFMINYGD